LFGGGRRMTARGGVWSGLPVIGDSLRQPMSPTIKGLDCHFIVCCYFELLWLEDVVMELLIGKTFHVINLSHN
jgi:hypothetical protein